MLDYGIKIIAVGFVPEGRRPSSSTAWLLAILLIPIVGLPLFLLMGSPYINRRRHRIQQEATLMIEDVQADVPDHPQGHSFQAEIASILHMNRRLTGMPAVRCDHHGIHTDYDEALRAMARAIDRAKKYVHLQIYITTWDDTTDVVFQALSRAVDRGIKVRLLFDHVGSWKYPGYWKIGRRLTAAGIDWRVMLPLQPWKGRFRRPDLRNHRKFLVVDGQRAFMGSQNLIDRSYLTRTNVRNHRQWVDIMTEISGPIVTSLELIFAIDWYSETGETINVQPPRNAPPLPHSTPNIAQLVPSGPGYTTEPNLRMFTSVVHHAKERLVLCSPYFIPDESLLEAVTSACYRGVRVELFVSEKADQFVVHHAQSSYYQVLLEAGVHIYLFPRPFVLHSKYVVADPTGDNPLAIIGSSNMDFRSFGLNYEISLMVPQGSMISELTELTDTYLGVSQELSLETWNRRSLVRRYIDNAMKLTSALQ
ncbi:cardiolipin synthase [Corynebacterium poyangense]|uniref:Cardiolipin synthase n=1 Tax=Corynebacterium poyangense TaxID=2684405 RepID=A0A7H0SSK3_9CORY|nr:cardiolipin synthase [Corynebacterium poyangense]MBZ8176521.1 cardiolipin synthase [Corynebacterium poyangense]QNQ91528.1 cardiolipin synthase [Corynebacterium poyangense]